MHSGQVTAGVLRGDRSRFQLFGDTVNTAARMESNGVKGRIHCSKATADELIAAGKNSWLTAREGGVEAKGKGRMETFFVSPHVAKSAYTGTASSFSGDSSHNDDGDDYEEES